MEAKHTPGPWSIGADGNVKAKFNANQHNIDVEFDGTTFTVAATMVAVGNAISENEMRANAAFIVRACNAHDDLVRALRKILETAEKSSFQAVGLAYLREVALPAIAKAGAA